MIGLIMSTAATASDATPLADAARQGYIDGLRSPLTASGLLAPDEWLTVGPRAQEDCLADSHGTIDAAYVRCRHGYQEQIRTTIDGRKHVIAERPIPNN